MANKRMFSNSVIDTDAFLDMPLSAQALYFHLNMKADDDGFVASPKRIQRTIGASDDDLRLLIAKRFVLTFDDGVLVIKHWRMHNTLSSGRYHETNFIEDKSMLRIKENGAYSLESGIPIDDRHQVEIGKRQTNRRQTSDEQETSLDKISIDKNREDKTNIVEKSDPINYQYIIDYLNKMAGSSYKPSTKKTRNLIKARINEGFTEEDFRKVIDKKVDEWIGTEMSKYLRPETLFGTKFEGYLNQKVEKRKKGINNFAQRDNDWDDIQRKLVQVSMR